MFLVFTRMPGESYRRQLRFLWLCLSDAYQLPCFVDFPVPWLGFSMRIRLWLCLWLYDPLTGTLCDWDTLGLAQIETVVGPLCPNRHCISAPQEWDTTGMGHMIRTFPHGQTIRSSL